MIALLIATVREGIETVFGRDTYPAVGERLEELVDRLASQAVQGHVAVLDDRVGMALMGLEPVSSGSTVGAVAAVRACADRQDCDAVLLVGGHQVLPMIRVRNPVSDRSLDPDREVLTDLPYGADGDGISDYVTGARMVSRLPSPHSRRLGDFLALLDIVARPAPSKSGSTAIVSAEWETAGRRVAAGMPGPVTFRVAPHYRLDDRHRDDLSCRWLYVNLHGYADKDEWQAFDANASRFLRVMDPASFSFSELSGSSMFCENCYGLKPLFGGPSETCVDRAFRYGLRAVVGATGLAYGAHLTRGMSGSSRYMENADFLAAAFFDGIRESLGAGEAFQNARQRLVANIRRRRPDPHGTGDLWLSRYEVKTLLQFQLFGDPTA